MSRMLVKWGLLLICFFGIGFLGFNLGSYQQQQIMYQMAGLQVERALGQLQYLHDENIQDLEYSLELSVLVGLIFLPRQDNSMTSLAESYVTRALNKTNCYAKSNSWKYISSEAIQTINKHIEVKLVNPQPCLLTHHSSGTPNGAP